MDPRIADFIRENRTRLTREAVTRQLEAAGHRREEIDWTWDRLAADEPIDAAGAGRSLGWYVWIVYVLGAIAVAVLANSFSGLGLELLALGWIAAYVLLAGLAAWFLARWRTSSVAGTVGLVILAPLIFVLIGGGICAATIVVVSYSQF